jgi:hypothetical protein
MRLGYVSTCVVKLVWFSLTKNRSSKVTLGYFRLHKITLGYVIR